MTILNELFGIIIFIALARNTIQQDTPQCVQERADIVFVLDSSGSIRESNPADGSFDNYDLLLDFVASIVDQLRIGPDDNQIGVVTFSNIGKNIFFLNDYQDKSDVLAAIARVPYEDANTNTSGGLRVMQHEQFTAAHGDRRDAANIAIVITDGVSTYDNDRTIADAEAARIAGIRIYSIGITDEINVDEVRSMSSRPQRLDENYFISSDFGFLDSLVDVLLQQTCTLPPEPLDDNEPDIDFCFDDKTDVVFVLDSSGSICGGTSGDLTCGRWSLVLEFIVDIVDTMTISSGNTRVGFVRYSTEADNQFFLDTYDTRYQVKKAIRNIPHIGSETNTSGAIRLMRDEQFKRKNGDRKNAENVAIIITDGESNVDKNSTISEAKKARKDDITIYTIGITSSINENEVKEMSSHPQKKDKNYFLSTDFESLLTMKIKVKCEDREYNALLFGMLTLAVVIFLGLLRLLAIYCHQRTKRYDQDDKEPLYQKHPNQI